MSICLSITFFIHCFFFLNDILKEIRSIAIVPLREQLFFAHVVDVCKCSLKLCMKVTKYGVALETEFSCVWFIVTMEH